MNKFKNLLSRLTLNKVKKILGNDAEKLLRDGGIYEIEIENDVELTADRLKVQTSSFCVELIYNEAFPYKLEIKSSTTLASSEVGAAFSLILEEKMSLGLSKPPVEWVPIESLSEKELKAQAIADRHERSKRDRIKIKSSDESNPYVDYLITNHNSGKSYRVAFRGFEFGVSYCSCPDFKINNLGTCKHLISEERYVQRIFGKKNIIANPYKRNRLSVGLNYIDDTPIITLYPPVNFNKYTNFAILSKYMDRPISDYKTFVMDIENAIDAGDVIHIHPDAEKFINKKLLDERIANVTKNIRENLENHPLRTGLLNAELRPYQLDGIAFAVEKGRSILADDMGLGKTIQGIGIAELFARETGIKKVLIMCPASLKSQWREEIYRFSGRSVQLVLGTAEERANQYDNDRFFTVCNYEQVFRDIMTIEEVNWDLIILDEGQRMKNWESLTSQTIRTLDSKFALVLSGTPLENKLEELYNIASFIAPHRLGSAFSFMNKHRTVDEKGKVLGYKNLDDFRKKVEPILLRRTRSMVLDELPERTNHIVRILPTEEQAAIDLSQRRIIQTIITKPYLTEMDILRLQKALLVARMAADSTFLVNKQEPSYSTKLEKLKELLEELLEDDTRKIILFSEWTTMLNLIEADVIQKRCEFVRLDGSVPQKKRGALVKEFNQNPKCKLFLSTNAGSTGLNLQAANTVINIDLPWNPAILEQRIGRAHRMGQKRPVDVYVLVSEGMLEESILGLLGAKLELANAAIDMESDLVEVTLQSGIEELKRRMEVLLGNKEEVEVDASLQNKVDEEIKEKQERFSEAGERLITSAFEFLGAAVNKNKEINSSPMAESIFNEFAKSADKDDNGKYNLNFSLDEDALKNLAGTLAAIMQV